MFSAFLLFTGCNEKEQAPAKLHSGKVSEALDDKALIAYLHFAQRQHSDPDHVVSRLKGYLDAHYDYNKTMEAEKLFYLMSDRNMPTSQEEAALALAISYYILGELDTTYEQFADELQKPGQEVAGNTHSNSPVIVHLEDIDLDALIEATRPRRSYDNYETQRSGSSRDDWDAKMRHREIMNELEWQRMQDFDRQAQEDFWRMQQSR